jgi:hypothetical protein
MKLSKRVSFIENKKIYIMVEILAMPTAFEFSKNNADIKHILKDYYYAGLRRL